MAEENCGCCLFYSERLGFSECHRNPPVHVDGSGDELGAWPKITEEDWCGEFKESK